MNDTAQLASSFRDPNGFVFIQDGILYRQINKSYQENYIHLHSSGLYDALVKERWITPYIEEHVDSPKKNLAYRIIRPERVPFISYPYEWSFSQLKDAALLTLNIQEIALKHGMTLKDSSAYNIQFLLETGKPILLDTLSFEIYQPGRPWVAYRQFCQHFLGPLALMAQTDVRLNQLSRIYIDGPPLALVSRLLPVKTRMNFGLLSHVHLHAKAQDRYAARGELHAAQSISQSNLLALIDNLKRTVRKLSWQPKDTEWGTYYEQTNYSNEALTHKKRLVKDYILKSSPKFVWDLGANTGLFSRIATECGASTIAFDIDPAAVEINYRQVKKNQESNLLPLLLDLTNPSPALGWENRERDNIFGRHKPDLIMSLALIHHLAISNNVPMDRIASMLAKLSPWLMIEFVPKQDSQVQRLLSTREDIFKNYDQTSFESIFSNEYDLVTSDDIHQSQRKLYLYKRKDR